MSGEIIFTANTDDWKAVKKLKIEKNVQGIDIATFLASVSISFDTKIEDYLKKSVNAKPLDEYIDSITKGTFKTEEDIAKVLKAINATQANKAINACIPEASTPKETDLLKSFLKSYLTKKTLLKINFCVDYSDLPLKINKGK
ncbi:MAG: hypothetical protein COT14_03110 [Candidatus Diapherotrites archaeon CG08_land_8_20_14_0_20_30_16]|nr:MAG: hypothetical protein COT14_03110 [Candidatus Diapherotrites archaeon CG08_land_8_20_14_0_20_30_16]